MAKKRHNHYHLTKVCSNGYLPTRFYPQSNAWYGYNHIHWQRGNGLAVTLGIPLWHRVSKYANPIGNNKPGKVCKNGYLQAKYHWVTTVNAGNYRHFRRINNLWLYPCQYKPYNWAKC